MEKFESVTECIKCGKKTHYTHDNKLNRRGEVKFIPAKWNEGVEIPEHMEANCNGCGYTWDELCKDAKLLKETN